MRISVIIPVWNGESVIRQCLQSLLANTAEESLEIICVDNASTDASRAVIAADFPKIKLLPQPVNLGFAGGVNVGLRIARGDFMVLLNQDFLVAPGWATAMQAVFEAHPECGIVGAMILNTDGSINHAGATIDDTLAYSKHLTAIPASALPDALSWGSEYVTGALFAIRRETWQQIGEFDEAYYPAYYEECDYCVRARRHGWGVRVAKEMGGTHLFSSREWQRDPIRHTADQYRSRYRYIAKHFSAVQLTDFLAAETDAARAEISYYHAVARTLAAGYIARSLTQLIADRKAAGASPLEQTAQRQLHVGFSEIRMDAFNRALLLSLPGNDDAERTTFTFEKWQNEVLQAHQMLSEARDWRAEQKAIRKQIATRLLEATRRLELEKSTEPDARGWQEYIQTGRELLSGQTREALTDLHEELLGFVEQLATLAKTEKQRMDRLEDVFAHRLNLLERQATTLEYRQRLTETLAKYEYL